MCIRDSAYPMRWLGRLREQWQQVPESVGPSREVLTDSILRRTRFWARKLTETAAWMEQYLDLYRGYGDRFLEMAEQLQGYEAAAQEGWDAMARLKPSFRRMGVVKGCDGAKEQAQAVRKRCKDELDEIGALLAVKMCIRDRGRVSSRKVPGASAPIPSSRRAATSVSCSCRQWRSVR